jgi:hypothetical protein
MESEVFGVRFVWLERFVAILLSILLVESAYQDPVSIQKADKKLEMREYFLEGPQITRIDGMNTDE